MYNNDLQHFLRDLFHLLSRRSFEQELYQAYFVAVLFSEVERHYLVVQLHFFVAQL